MSDALCRLASGSGLQKRRLYSDDGVFSFALAKPIIVNGIEDFVCRPDLLDRSVILRAEMITSSTRRSERQFWADFGAAKPQILGALLTAVSTALRRLPELDVADVPRMADAYLFALAAEPGLGLPNGTIASAFNRNQVDANLVAIDSNVVGAAILRLTQEQSNWTGTADTLLGLLLGDITRDRAPKGWPTSARGMRSALERIKPALRANGIVVEFRQATDRNRTRLIGLRREDATLP
jgi:hypothetical protein